ncbi:hypothetical protein PUN28_015334 [Cardiocondyla obscurior]|uniref:Uncharacterized protein n=1 Tax=Cardiocondyla obscurior TaxID=286306 RepID=A0AAW2ETQ3_9HYME
MLKRPKAQNSLLEDYPKANELPAWFNEALEIREEPRLLHVLFLFHNINLLTDEFRNKIYMRDERELDSRIHRNVTYVITERKNIKFTAPSIVEVFISVGNLFRESASTFHDKTPTLFTEALRRRESEAILYQLSFIKFIKYIYTSLFQLNSYLSIVNLVTWHYQNVAALTWWSDRRKNHRTSRNRSYDYHFAATRDTGLADNVPHRKVMPDVRSRMGKCKPEAGNEVPTPPQEPSASRAIETAPLMDHDESWGSAPSKFDILFA